MAKSNSGPAQAVYAELCRFLAGRVATDATPACRWLGRGLLDAVAMPLHGGPDRLELWLGADAARGDVPRSMTVGGHRVDLQVHAHARLRAQAASAFNASRNTGLGTIAALVRDRLHADRYYLLSCGHVFGGSPQAQIGDSIDVELGGVRVGAKLVDWEPVLVDGIPHTGIDAAIARIEDAARQRLTGLPLPLGTSSTYRYDQPVTLKLTQNNDGLLRTRWSGYVDVEGTDRERDYYLENAIGYQTSVPSLPGDSGAAVWDQHGNLLGIHVGAPIGNEQWRSNAVFCPIDRIMDWFDIEPVTANAAGAVLTPDSARVASRPQLGPVPAQSQEEVLIIAKTLWGEARGEGTDGMRAVACVIGNRKELKWQGKIGYAAVCLAYKQFSCWNDGDPNRSRMDAQARHPDSAFTEALAIAGQLVSNQLNDMTFGATHYYATSLRQAPKWAQGVQPCFQLGRHLFFSNIK